MTIFRVGDVVKHKTISTADKGLVLKVLGSSHCVVLWDNKAFGQCTDPFGQLVLIHRKLEYTLNQQVDDDDDL